jgi:hypothetical protein
MALPSCKGGAAMRAKQGEGPQCQLKRYFEMNPTEELSYEDVVAKFGSTLASARTAVARLKATGDIEAVYVIRRKAGAKP